MRATATENSLKYSGTMRCPTAKEIDENEESFDIDSEFTADSDLAELNFGGTN